MYRKKAYGLLLLLLGERGKGAAFCELTRQHGLEGIVAKRKDSQYYFDKRTKDWIKIKNMQDDDFIVCGYILKENHMTSIVLGQFLNGTLIYKGYVTLGVGGESFRKIRELPRIETPPFAVPEGNENAVWVSLCLVCVVHDEDRKGRHETAGIQGVKRGQEAGRM